MHSPRNYTNTHTRLCLAHKHRSRASSVLFPISCGFPAPSLLSRINWIFDPVPVCSAPCPRAPLGHCHEFVYNDLCVNVSSTTSFPVCWGPLSPCQPSLSLPLLEGSSRRTKPDSPPLSLSVYTHTVPTPPSLLNSSHLLPCHNSNSHYHCYCFPGVPGPRQGAVGVKFICSALNTEPVKEKRCGITLTAWLKTPAPLFLFVALPLSP